MFRPKINRDVLRCECMTITPNGYAPDILTQMRLNPPPFVYAVHQLVVHHLIQTGISIPGGEDKVTNVKQACVYRTVLTDMLLKQIHRLPQEEKVVVYSDPEHGFPILERCLSEAEDNFVFSSIKPSTINKIFNSIRCAYGSKHATPQDVILARLNVVERERDKTSAPERTENTAVASSGAYL